MIIALANHLARKSLGWLFWLAACATPLAQSGAAEPEVVKCPQRLALPRLDFPPPAGWEVYWSRPPGATLEGAEIVVGRIDPPPLTHLAPRFSHTAKTVTGYWNLGPPMNDRDPIWLFCQYEDTALRLIRMLPKSARSCTLTGTNLGDGNAVPPMTVACR